MDEEMKTPEPRKRKLGDYVKPEEVKSEPPMSLDSFITVKKFSISILHRIEIFLSGDIADRTEKEWEEVYSLTMNRITK